MGLTGYNCSCWDGKSLDSPDHKTHIAYPVAGPPGFDPSRFTCPDTHPVKIPQLMLEVRYRSFFLFFIFYFYSGASLNC